METEAVIKIGVDGSDAGRSLKSLKLEFKELQGTLEGLEVGSQKYIETLKKLGQVKDDIGDLNTTIKAFNPEGKIQAVSGAIGGLASGFEAATAASVLFGAENKGLEKSLLKVQSAMAFADGIRGLVGLGDQFKVLKAIILSNPLFIFAAVVTAITTALYAMKDSIPGVGAAFEKIGAAVQTTINYLKQFTDWLGISEFKLQENLAASEKYVKQREASEKHLHELNKFIDKEEAEILKEKQRRNKEYLDAKEKAQEESWARAKAIDDENNKRLDKEYEERIKALDALYLHSKSLQDQTVIDDLAKIELKRTNDIAEIEAEYLKTNQLVDATKYKTDAIAAIELTAMQSKEALQKQAAEKEKANADNLLKEDLARIQKRQAQQTIALQTSQAVSDAFFAVKLQGLDKESKAYKDIARKQFNINKALQATQVIVNTAAGVAAALAIQNYPGAAATAISGAAGLVKIAATKFDEGAGGNGSIAPPTTPTPVGIATNLTPTSAPILNAPTSNIAASTDLNEDGTVKQQAPIIKAYVVESEMTDVQKSVRNIQRNATIS